MGLTLAFLDSLTKFPDRESNLHAERDPLSLVSPLFRQHPLKSSPSRIGWAAGSQEERDCRLYTHFIFPVVTGKHFHKGLIESALGL